ncbi:EamA family transporter [Propionivibrio sp.]|uniref:EamA family transporter n=1 Tax=Propionivibrio sp. TaxID=2212460 RepID=UPI003BF20D89
MITTPVALLVLLSALMHASWNYLVKASPDRLLDTAGLAVGGSLISACLLPFVPLPAAESLPWLGVTVFIHIAYFMALIETYRHADLSIAYPLMRGTAPVLVALVAPLAGETITPGLLAGIVLIGIGITLPAWLGFRRAAVAKAGIWFACCNAVIIAAYTIVDGIGVRLSGSAASYTLWLFFLDAWGIFAIAWWQRGRAVMTHLRRRWAPALAGSVLTLGSYGIVLWAMTKASIPAVAALRETSVIFAVLLGALLLRERMGRWRAAGAVLVALGAAVIRWG